GPTDGPGALSDTEQQALQSVLDLDEDELTEVTALTFTPLDAHYLDCCFLMRDVALNNLDLAGLPLLDQARIAFDWVVRQVRLDGQDGTTLAPTEYVLRRGSGSVLERALVYVALLKQMNLHGCLISVPATPKDTAMRDALVGVLIGQDIYLFDPALGLPLPGAGGKGVATLAQVRADPGVLKRLTVDPKVPYDLSPEQVRKAHIRLVCSLSGVTPRMKYLEDLLAGSNHVKLVDDISQLRDKFQAAAGKNVPVEFREKRSSGESLARIARRFLPPAEGGTDKTGREQQFRLRLFPLAYLPAQLGDLAESVPQAGEFLRGYFALLFEDFPLESQTIAAEIQRRLRAEAGPQGQPPSFQGDDLQGDWNRKFTLLYLSRAAIDLHNKHPWHHFALASQSPRDDMLRGRLERAANRLSDGVEQVEYQHRQASDPASLSEPLQQWKDQLTDAYAKFNRLRDAQAHGRAAKDPQALRQAEAQVLMSWPLAPAALLLQPGMTMKAPPWLALLLHAAADPLGEQARYFAGLCAQEQAERQQRQIDHAVGKTASTDVTAARDAWSAAASRWQNYLDRHQNGPGAATARLLRARALQMLGQTAQAVTLLQEVSNVSPAEKLSRLYLAHQLTHNGKK
ncbi:MAG TPA: hypothetical protein VFA18_00825, partial [Gemmataceae bacterium]|nr:hypothetical protein [Gemmataceae bacterium]